MALDGYRSGNAGAQLSQRDLQHRQEHHGGKGQARGVLLESAKGSQSSEIVEVLGIFAVLRIGPDTSGLRTGGRRVLAAILVSVPHREIQHILRHHGLPEAVRERVGGRAPLVIRSA